MFANEDGTCDLVSCVDSMNPNLLQDRLWNGTKKILSIAHGFKGFGFNTISEALEEGDMSMLLTHKQSPLSCYLM